MQDGGITIEPVSKENSDALALIEGLMDIYAALFTPETIRQFAEAESGDGDSEYVFFIARRGGIAAGCGGVRLMGDGATGEVKRIYVAPEHRGSGVARTLMAAIEREAAARGLSRLVLTTAERLAAAVRMYEVLGYSRIPNYGPYAGIGVIISYEKRLP